MDKIEAVLDTNIVVSAFLTSGPASAILQLWGKKRFGVIISSEIIEEYYMVLSRDKFHMPNSLIKTIIDEFVQKAIRIKKTSKINLISADPADDKFIETAVDGGANYIISGDKHLLNIKKYKNIEILSASEFLLKF